MIKSPYCRQGNKLHILKDIIELIPQHAIYCEPFVGSGVVFFNLPKASHGSILNDLDKNVVNILKLIKKAPLSPNRYRHDLNTLEKIKHFCANHNNTTEDLLLHNRILLCNGFNNRIVKHCNDFHNTTNPDIILKNLKYYKQMLKGVKISNKDYIDIILKYDSPETFFFIDPPYENTDKTFYYNIVMNYEVLSFLLQNIKGKFLLTINDGPNIRKIFKGFTIKSINIKSTWYNTTTKKIRKELFIMNY
jgi:DNA adenine methylase